MAYTIRIDPDALSDIESLPKKVQRQVHQKILRLKKDPRPTSASPLHGEDHKGFWKLRSGDYRVIYKIQDKTLVVIVVKVGDRKDIYKRLRRMLSKP